MGFELRHPVEDVIVTVDVKHYMNEPGINTCSSDWDFYGHDDLAYEIVKAVEDDGKYAEIQDQFYCDELDSEVKEALDRNMSNQEVDDFLSII